MIGPYPVYQFISRAFLTFVARSVSHMPNAHSVHQEPVWGRGLTSRILPPVCAELRYRVDKVGLEHRCWSSGEHDDQVVRNEAWPVNVPDEIDIVNQVNFRIGPVEQGDACRGMIVP